jgi:hypothetical protein
MKFKKIVGFGDSWMWGDELLDPKLATHKNAHPILVENTPYRESNCFLGQLGKHYNVPTENFGIPGGSLQSTIWTYLWWRQHETVPLDQCAVLVGLTDPNRQTFYNPKHTVYANDAPWNRFVHSSWIHSGGTTSGDPWTQMVKSHMVLTDCDAVHKLNYQQTVLFFQGQSCFETGPLLQFNTMGSILDMPCSTLIWPTQSLNYVVRSETDSANLFAPMGHPSEKGHAVLRDRLITEIDRAIIAQ